VQELNKRTIFSSLVSKKTRTNEAVNVKLDIPDLPEDVKFYQLQVPGTDSYEWVDYASARPVSAVSGRGSKERPSTDDEGFCSVKSSPVSEGGRREVWDTILDMSISDYVDWDMRKELVTFFVELNQCLLNKK
jgi:hypothetical protein